MKNEIFNVEKLRSLSSREQIESYFDSIGFTEYNQRVQALNQAMNNSHYDCFHINDLTNSEEQKDKMEYETLITLILDEEVRFIKSLKPLDFGSNKDPQ